MGLLAFDVDLNDKVNANDAIKKEKGKYICPSPRCREKKVPVYLSEKQTGNYFISYDKSLHDENCDFPTSYNSAYHNFIPTNFSVESIYDSISNKQTKENKIQKNKNSNNLTNNRTSKNKNVEIKTPYQLYRFCSSNDPDFKIGDKEIRDFFISSSTENFWYNMRRDVTNTLLLAVGYTYQIIWKENRIRLIIDDNSRLKISIIINDDDYFRKTTLKIKKYDSNMIKMFVIGYANSQSYSFIKKDNKITYIELTINAINNSIHFLSKKKSNDYRT